MALVIKTNVRNAPLGANKLYKDALVSEGTLILHDFSNRGCLQGFDISKGSFIYDLSEGNIVHDNVDNLSEFISNDSTNSLTLGKGIDRSNFTGSIPSNGVLGYNCGSDVFDYLSSNNNKSLLTAWVRSSDIASGGRIVQAKTNSGNGYNFTINSQTISGESGFNMSFAGVISTPVVGEELTQLSMEFTGVGNKVNLYINGALSGETSVASVGFGSPTTGIMVGRSDGNLTSNIKLYRFLIEDLNISGRSALDVVNQDWEYCTGTGRYRGLPTRRPFIDYI